MASGSGKEPSHHYLSNVKYHVVIYLETSKLTGSIVPRVTCHSMGISVVAVHRSISHCIPITGPLSERTSDEKICHSTT